MVGSGLFGSRGHLENLRFSYLEAASPLVGDYLLLKGAERGGAFLILMNL